MYVRSKRIKGQTYYYLVKSERHGKKVTQKFIRYLGKAGGVQNPEGKQQSRAGLYNQSAKGMPEKLKALAREARQFASAKEFAFQVEYHGTSSVEAAASIRKNGFVIGKGQAGVSTTQDYEEAMDYAEGDPSRVISVFVKKGAPASGVEGKDFFTGTGSFYPKDLIPLPEGFSPTEFYNQAVQGNTI